jgi:serine beta-lactamase-like protein LACTB
VLSIYKSLQMQHKSKVFPSAAVIVLLVTLFTSCAQQENKLSSTKIASIDSAISVFMTHNKVPGVSVSVGTLNEILWEKGYGMADLENRVPARPNTVYRLASASKSITAIAVMQLVEKGKIDLNAPVQTYIPTFPKKKYPITTRQLLGHLSGVHHYLGAEEFNMHDFKNIEDGFSLFMNDTLQHEPETKFTYTSYGYNILGVIVEKASGMTFMEYLNQNIFRPAGMTQTFADNPFQIIPNRTRFYDSIDGHLLNATYINTGYRIPSGGMLSTTADLERFMFAVERGALVKKSTLDEMFTPMKTKDGTSTAYGYGWIIGLSEKHPDVIWHGGVQPGCTTSMSMIPAKNISVVVLTNLGTMGTLEIVSITDQLFTILSEEK